MPDAIHVAPGVVIPASALSLKTVRSSGPGGQNVNKVASKVELRVDLGRIEGLSAEARDRLVLLCRGRFGADGRLLVTSQRTRDQRRNLEDAEDKVRRLVAQSLVPPRRRRATRPHAASREERLRLKKQASARKRSRDRIPPGESD